MLQAAITFAAETVKSHPSKTPFYICGGLLALWALVVSAIGIARHEAWPASTGAARGVMSISVVLVAAAMATAVITS